jgi:hypothetical protein
MVPINRPLVVQGMARWPILLLSTLLLAGCSSPPATDDGVEDDTGAAAPKPSEGDVMPQAPSNLGWEPWTRVTYGTNRGVGAMPPGDGCHFVGVSTMDDGFLVRDGAAVQVTLTWNVSAPSAIYLVLWLPGQEALVLDGLPLGVVERRIEYSNDAAPAGTWGASVCHQGPAVVDYALTVAVSHAS